MAPLSRSRLLIVEDEPALARRMEVALVSEGGVEYDIRHASDGEAALALALEWKPDLVLLDMGLPKLDGLSVLRRMRKSLQTTRICIVSAAGALESKLAGFQEGSDDYLVKPFASEELRARVIALLRRGRLVSENALIFRDLSLSLATGQVHRGEKAIRLTPKELSLLSYLMRRPDQAVSRSELLDEVWEGKDRYPNVVDAHIESLRQKIDRPFGSRLIQTAYGKGYYFDTRSS